MLKYLNALAIAAVIAAGGALPVSVFAQDMGGMPGMKPATTAPAATQAAMPACCGDACKKMKDCCKADDKGKVTCSMGGSCCVKADSKKADDKGMGGMDMGK
jgi:hypothetical protein